MRTLGRFIAVIVAVIAGLVALIAFLLWLETAQLPYNSEGRYFDGTIVYTDGESQFAAVVGCISVALGTVAGLLAWKLRRR